MKLQDLAASLLSMDPQGTPPRLAFYHFLKNFRRLDEEFTPDVLESFYHRAILFQQWQNDSAELGRCVARDLERIFQRHILSESPKNLRHSHELQWIRLEKENDFMKLLEEETQEFLKMGQKVKLLPLSDKETMRLRLAPAERKVHVEVKTRWAYVDGVRLRLVRPSTALAYNTDLELLENAVQVLQISPLKFARFVSQSGRIHGMVLQGATFAKMDTFNDKLESVSEVFWPLKSLEKFFVNPMTDSHYLQLLAELEDALGALKSFHPNREMVAAEAFRKGKIYQEKIFQNDKVLKGLLSTLAYQLRRDDAEVSDTCPTLSPLPPSV